MKTAATAAAVVSECRDRGAGKQNRYE